MTSDFIVDFWVNCQNFLKAHSVQSLLHLFQSQPCCLTLLGMATIFYQRQKEMEYILLVEDGPLIIQPLRIKFMSLFVMLLLALGMNCLKEFMEKLVMIGAVIIQMLYM